VHFSRPDREGLLPVLAAADVVVVQATTVGAQAHAAGKRVLGLGFSPIVQRTGMDYARLGLAADVPELDALLPVLERELAAIRRVGGAGAQGEAARRVAAEIAQLAPARRQGTRP
jgi:hypothetical protein